MPGKREKEYRGSSSRWNNQDRRRYLVERDSHKFTTEEAHLVAHTRRVEVLVATNTYMSELWERVGNNQGRDWFNFPVMR